MYSPKTSDDGPDTHTWKYLREVRKPSNSGFHLDASRITHGHAEARPRSYTDRPVSYHVDRNDGDTDSSFSWQGSNNNITHVEGGNKWL